MRLLAIRKRCLASKQMIIINGDDGAQWISDGANCYAIAGIRIRENYIQDVFALTDKHIAVAPLRLRAGATSRGESCGFQPRAAGASASRSSAGA